MPFEMTMTMFWLIAMVFFLVVEAVTVGLVCIWFAAGSLVALLCAMLNAPVWLQIALFLIVSAVTLYYTRPLVKKYVNNKVEPTNADAVIGKGEDAGVLICRQQDLEILPVHAHRAVGEAAEVELVDCVAGVADQFPQEDLLIAVNRIDHQIQQLFALCLELFDCHIQNLFFVECRKMMLALLNGEC